MRPRVLEEALRRKRRRCMVGTGSMCDPYLPLERELNVTRRCLEAIERQGFGVAVLTKSNLLLRDLELLRRIHRKARVVVCTTFTTLDENLCRLIEPNVCTTRQRFEMLRACREAGLLTGVWLCPILPFLNDTEENLRGLLELCFAAGVGAIINFGMGVTLQLSRIFQAECRARDVICEANQAMSWLMEDPQTGEQLRLF